MISIYFLPLDFIYYTKLSSNGFHSTQNFFSMLRLYQYSSIEIGVICTVFIAFVEPNMYHVNIIRLQSYEFSMAYSLFLITLRCTERKFKRRLRRCTTSPIGNELKPAQTKKSNATSRI